MGPAGEGRPADPAVSAGQGSAGSRLRGGQHRLPRDGPRGRRWRALARQGRETSGRAGAGCVRVPRAEQGSSRMVRAATGRMVQEKMTASDRIPQVLVVDDEPNIRELVQVALKFHGCAVSTAGTGTDALR